MTEEIHKVGVLEKGDGCAVSVRGSVVLCRVVSSLPFDDDNDAMYECITPHGSVIVSGSVWVLPTTEEQNAKLAQLEADASENGFTLYAGRL